jgi:hypothetical protein
MPHEKRVTKGPPFWDAEKHQSYFIADDVERSAKLKEMKGASRVAKKKPSEENSYSEDWYATPIGAACVDSQE